jgi:hypothetical protein
MAMVMQHIQLLANNNKKWHNVFGRKIASFSFFWHTI